MNDPWEELREGAYQVRLEYQSGALSYPEARKALKLFLIAANARADVLAAKYQQKPRHIRAGDFLRGPL